MMKKKLWKIFFILFGIGVLFGIGIYLYVFHKPHRNLANEKSDFEITASVFIKEFADNEDASYKKYGDKAILVKGKIAEITPNGSELTIILEDQTAGISCGFETGYAEKNAGKIANLKVGDEISIKGKCDGYDMIMGIVLTRCVLSE